MSDGESLTGWEARQDLHELMRSEKPFQERARGALELGKQYLGSDTGLLAHIDRETEHWEVVASTDGPTGEYPRGLELDLGATYCRQTLERDAPVVLSNAPDQGWATDPAFERHELHCYHGTKLTVDGEPYGSLCFVAEDPRKERFSEDETMFAGLIAHALERELERERHERRLTQQSNLAIVLNRVLRHNLRNEMSVIRGYTQLMADRFDDETVTQKALQSIDNLLELSEKARQLEHVITADQQRESTDIAALVDECVLAVEESNPDATITVEAENGVRAPVLSSFRRAIEELVENAVKHSGETPTVVVAIEAVSDGVEVRITDDGPGLSPEEVTVLETGEEKPLAHGSGLGLWLSNWIVASHDGTIEPTVTDDGTVLTVTVPQTEETTHEQMDGLGRARDQYKASFEEAGDGMTITDDSARILDVNEEAARIYGEDRDALLGRSMQELLPNDFDFETEWGEIQAESMKRDELDIVSADGGVSSIEYVAKTDIVPGQHLIVSRDITDRKERERHLEETADRLESVIGHCPEPIVVLDDSGVVRRWNGAAEGVLGFEAEAVLGERIQSLDLFTAEHAAAFEENIERVLAGETVRNVEVQRRSEDDTRLELSLSAAPLRDDTGSVDEVVVTATDVTETRTQTQELERARERYRIVAENFPNGGVFLFDSDARFQLAAGEGLETAGLDSASFEGLRVEEVLDGELPTPFVEMCHAALEGESREEELSFRERTYRVQTVPVDATDRDAAAGIAIVQNITQHEELKRFASTVSHDLRNPLNVAQGQLTLARESGEQTQTHLEEVDSALSRMRALIDDLLTLAQSEGATTEHETVDFGAVVTDCWANVETGDARLVNQVDGTIRADETRLKQVLENLFSNACEHGGDDVTVTVGQEAAGFYIEDTGPGISPSDREKVFEEGYSSNTDGTGFGLSIVERRVEAHGWTIDLEEASTGGARFVIGGVESGQE